jgi:hypothetical protein
MKIQQLIQREPFGDILQETLAHFLPQVFAGSFEVRWSRSNPRARIRAMAASCGETWHCNPYLNAVFSTQADRAVLGTVWQSYINTPMSRRRYAQWVYVTAATSPLLAPLFATYTLDIRPALPRRQHMLVLGGNNRIRLVDLEHGRTWDILKAGFDPAPIRTELAVRQVGGGWPFPAVRAVATDGTWFESDFIKADCLNRIPASVARQRLAANAFDTLGRWLDRSLAPLPLSAYLDETCCQIERLLERGPLFTADDHGAVCQWLAAARGALWSACQDGESLDLAYGHGDFQDGNMLVDAGAQVWIVDWEHAGRRQLAYDYLVYALRSRFPDGLASRIRAAASQPEGILDALPSVHPRLLSTFSDQTSRRTALILFLLEDLLWNLQENANPLFTRQSGAWLQLKNEIGPGLAALVS